MAGLLELPQDQFMGALNELGIVGAQRDDLIRQKRNQDSIFSGLFDYFAPQPGMERANIAPMIRPEGMSGLEAITSGQAQLALPGMFTGALTGAAQAADAPRAAYAGQIPMADMAGEAGNVAGLLTMGGLGAAGRGVMDYDPTMVSMGVDLNRFPFYHGTPDARDVRAAGGFAEGKPVFLSDNPSVARTYADPRRAWDYQGAEPEVFKAMTSPQRVLDIDAGGSDFRGISADAVKRGLVKAGIAEDDASARIAAAAARRTDARISTNDLADIVRGLGFDAADIANVRDTYNATAKAPKSTVRMMFSPSQINIQNR
jgi:hypothetical protein